MSNTGDELWSLPESWMWVTMSDVAEVVGGGTPDTKIPENFGGDVPWVTPADMSTHVGKAISGGARSLTPQGLRASGARWLPKGAILFSSRAPIGYTAIASQPVTTNQGFKSFVLANQILPDYAYHWLSSAKEHAEKLASGTTFLEISGAKAALLSFPLAPEAEQSRIVEKLEELLSDLDAGVAELKAARRKLMKYRQSLLKAAVEGVLTADWRQVHGRSQEPDAEGTQNTKCRVPAMPSLPQTWRWATASMVGDILLGRQRAPQFLTGRHSRKYLRVANIKDDRVDFSDLASMDFDETHFKKYVLLPGDILVSEGQSPELVGQSAIFRGFDEPLCFQKTLHRFRAKQGVTLPEFAQIVFRSNVASGVFRALASITTNIAHLTLEKFKGSPFPLPPIEEQEEIVSRVDRFLASMAESDRAIEASLRQAAAQRKNLLKAAFAGQLVPQDPNDESARELLARIRADRASKDDAPRRRRKHA